MSDSDRLLLTEIIKQEQASNAKRSNVDQYFEFFSAEQVLKKCDLDLDPEEVRSGMYGGGDDGGVDSVFLFANTRLVREDDDLPAFGGQQLDIELVVITTKFKNSFAEGAVEKLQTFTDNCLRLDANPLVYRKLYNSSLQEAAERFRNLFRIAAPKRPTLKIRFFYASIGDEIHDKVKLRARELERKARELFSIAEVTCDFVGASELLRLFNRVPTKTLMLKSTKIMPSSAYGTAYVCFVQLANFYDFITDDRDNIRTHIFESNIRAFQGEVTVNKEIEQTLTNRGDEEFWWLNNGVTIIASKVTSAGDDIVITDPMIVNGLQTSYKIHAHFQKNKTDDARSIMVRVIESTNPQSVDKIIKATNSQTKVDKIYLHATEEVHRKIEVALKTADLYYDRRKNYYRGQGVQAAKIVTLPYLSQAVAAIFLQRPNDARARPTTVADMHYANIFSDKHPVKLYVNCARVMKKLDDFLTLYPLTQGEKNNIIFHTAMYAVARTFRIAKPKAGNIADMDIDQLTDEMMEQCFDKVQEVYKSLGGNDKVAKGPRMIEMLKKELEERFIAPLRAKRVTSSR